MDTHDLALGNIRLNQLAELRPLAILLSAQKIAGGQMHEPILAHEVSTLRALPGAGAAEDKDNGSFVRTERGLLNVRAGEVGLVLLGFRLLVWSSQSVTDTNWW